MFYTVLFYTSIMKIIHKHIVNHNKDEYRLIEYVLDNIDNFNTRSSAKKAIKAGVILVNNIQIRTTDTVQNGDSITIIEVEKPIKEKTPVRFNVVYEDQYIAVIDKPAGIIVSGNTSGTVQSNIKESVTISDMPDALNEPLPVHRLDKATSGLLIIAKTKGCRVELGNMLQNKTITKKYRAIVHGLVTNHMHIKTDIDNKPCHSEIVPVETVTSTIFGELSVLDLYPHTGRTHQLRIHCSQNGTPIIGDTLYSGSDKRIKGKGLFLAAIELKFKHPITEKDIHISIDQPNKFSSFLNREKNRWDKYNKK